MFGSAGPLWAGKLWDAKLNSDMLACAQDTYLVPLLETIHAEAPLSDIVGFYDLHELCRGISGPPSTADILERLTDQGLRASRTHFSGHGIRADCEKDKILELINR